MEDKSELFSWKEFIALLACTIMAPILLFMVIDGVKNFKREQKYAEMFAQIDIDDFESFNRLCLLYTSLSVEQKWEETAKQWSDMCLRHNKEFFDKYDR